ncbi:MAG TPA: hypothetical protein IAB67_06255 [Candidatus Ventrousia excrementavium]|uniref:Hint domain-containing protein n=1 Tax=Candidatus Ventrousia excrementavium TaxID=2840961 RepID=A0A9D1IW94_9CLOT|nr:hypothetical protein [Candidatus Ventrousia excrementavium]
MPLKRAPNAKELEKLIAIFLKAETDIINEIGRLRSMGNVDYHAVAALERVQAILRKMESDSWEYVPRMIEREFYVRVPEARRIEGETVQKHAAGYANAAALTGEQTAIVDRLAMNLMGEITDACMTAMETVQSAIIGRIEPDVYRRVGLEQVAAQAAAGRGVNQSVPAFVEALRREGVRAFTDKAGRNWSLHTYCTMASRTTQRQAEVSAVLTADPEQDLYQISSHGTTCSICAPLEGRVYSRSGTDPDFPPLTLAFGKVDPNGPDNLANTWLNIHPNCLVPGGLVLAEGVVAHSSREYSGPVVTLETSHGNRITVTPNHPILTTKGFIAAGMLQKGDKIIEAAGKYRFLFGEAPNDINIPTPIEDIGHSIIETSGSSAISVKGAAVQFHGDGIPDSEVKIVLPKGLAKGENNSLRCQPISKNCFPSAHFRRRFFFPKRALFEVFNRSFGSAHSIMCCSGLISRIKPVPIQSEQLANIGLRFSASGSDFCIAHPLIMKLKKPLKLIGASFNVTRSNVKKFFGRLWCKYPIVNHSALDGVFGYAKMFRHLRISDPLAAERLQSLFCQDALVVSNLVHVSTSQYSGKVYNLQTEHGFYTYNNIVTHNCLHALIPWTPAGRSEKEIREIRDFSDPRKNPLTHDPRDDKQIEAYRKKEAARRRWLASYRQWERYRMTLGDKVPRTFQTFDRHKKANDDKYKAWERLYRDANNNAGTD